MNIYLLMFIIGIVISIIVFLYTMHKLDQNFKAKLEMIENDYKRRTEDLRKIRKEIFARMKE